MIINLLINAVLIVVGALFSFLPVVNIASIPYVGPGLSSILTTAVTSWNAFTQTFPYALTAWHVLLFVILPFEITLVILKMLIGHRAPGKEIHNAN